MHLPCTALRRAVSKLGSEFSLPPLLSGASQPLLDLGVAESDYEHFKHLPLTPVFRSGAGLVVKDFLNLLHRLVIQLLNQLNRLAVVLDLLDLRCS